MTDARVSIIVATFNSCRTLKLSLQSILHQSMQDFVVHVVGDCCTDDSEAAVRAFADNRLTWSNLPINTGTQSAPNNLGLTLSNSPLVAYLGHDDLWFPHHLETLVACMESSDADFVHSMAPYFGPTGLHGVVGVPREAGGHTWHSAPPSCWLIKRSWAQQLGGWRKHSELPSGVDMDFFNRAWSSGAKIVMAERVTIAKFPSPNFKIYDQSMPMPQALALERMQRDPAEFEKHILTEAAKKLAWLQYADRPWRAILADFNRITLRKLRKFVLSKPLLARLEVHRFQWYRQRLKKRRGLV